MASILTKIVLEESVCCKLIIFDKLRTNGCSILIDIASGKCMIVVY